MDDWDGGAAATKLEELAPSLRFEPKIVMTHSTTASAMARENSRALPLKMQASKDMTEFLVGDVVVPFPLNTGGCGRPYRHFSHP
jgi:hypothetical protein